MKISLFIICMIVHHLGGCSGYLLKFSESVCHSIMSNESSVQVSCEDSAIVKSILQELNIVITFNEAELLCGNSDQTSEEKGLYLIRSHNTLESIADLMIYWRRYIAAFLFDDHSGLHPQRTFSYLQKRSIEANLVSLDHKSDINAEILKSTNYQNIVIICQPNLLKQIIDKAKSHDLFAKNFTWIIVNGNTPEAIVGVDIPPNSQVTLMSPQDFTLTSIENNFMLFGPVDVLPDKVSKNKTGTWSKSGYLCPRILRPSEISIDEIKILLKPEDKTAAYLRATPMVNIYDVFFSPTTNRTESVQFADWKSNRRHRLIMIEIFNRNNKLRLRERRVRVVVFQHLPYSIFTRINGTLHVDGYLREMIGTLLSNFNLRYTIREIDSVFGIGVNGSYTGMVGMFFRREADMAMNILAMTNSRASAVRYAGPVTKAHLAIVYNRPPAIIPPTTYLMPFSLPVWIAIIILFIIIMFFTFVTLSTIHSSNDERNSTLSQRIHKRLFRVVTLTYIEEVMEYPPGAAAKVIHGTLLLATLAVFIHYTSTFTAFLAYKEEKLPFRSIEDVVARKDYKIVVTKNSRHQDMLQFAPPGPYLSIWHRILKQDESTFSKTFEGGYYIMCTSPKYVLLGDGPTSLYVRKGNCSTAFAPVKYMKEYYNTPHRRDFPYTRIFTMGLMKILESGILKRLTHAYQLETIPPCHIQDPNASFGISQVMGIFVLYACGIILSLIALLVERRLPKRLTLLSLNEN